MRRALAAAAVTLVAALALSGCGGSSGNQGASGNAGPSGGSAAQPTVSQSGDPQLGSMQQKVDAAESAAAAAESDAAQNN